MWVYLLIVEMVK